MTKQEELALIDQLSELVYGIKVFEARIEWRMKECGFRVLANSEHQHKLEIYTKCIERLKQRYNRVLMQLHKNLMKDEQGN